MTVMMEDTVETLRETLTRAQRALADEIRRNPNREWEVTLMSRFKSYLHKFSPGNEEVGPIENWLGGVEVTEAVLRSTGFEHSNAP